MKRVLNLLPMAIMALGLGLSSCSQEKGITPEEGGLSIQLFSSLDNVRVTSTDGLVYSWESGDQIGVTSTTLNGKNIAYSAEKSAPATNFIAVQEAQAYKIPFDDSETHDIKAYYPYKVTDTGKLDIDLSTENKALLFATGTVSKTNPTISLNFKHQLSMLRIAIDATAVGADATTATVSAEGLLSKATFDITTGVLTNGTETAKINLQKAGNEFYAFLLPGEVLKDKVISIALDNKNYKATLTTEKTTEAGKYYKYTVTLATGETPTTVEDATIEDMNEGETGNIDGAPVTPEPTPAEPVEGTLSSADNSFDASSKTLSAVAEGGNYTLTLSGLEAGKEVTATAAPAADWVTLNDHVLRAVADQTLNIVVAENTTTEERSTVVTLKAEGMKDLSFTITQAAKENTAEPETPAVTEGDGTEANPYTVAQAIANRNKKGIFVKGYIVGAFSGTDTFDSKGTVDTNIVIADTPNETDVNKVMPVQLPSGDTRNKLNLKDHPENKGKQVVLGGDLTAYFKKPGLKNTSSYKIL